MKLKKLLSISAMLALVITAGAVAPATPALSADVAPELQSFYSQTLTWTKCGNLQCATIKVPLNWNKPAAGSIKLALNYLPSTGTADKGWLLENPGGPGGVALALPV